MIVFFHLIILVSKYLVTTLTKSTIEDDDLSDVESNCTENSEDSPLIYQESTGSGSRYINGDLKFTSPVFLQRYEIVCSILQQSPWKDTLKKVVDFGCSELGFFLYLKHVPGLEEILEVDIDEYALQRGASKAAPLNSDYLFCKRANPLNVYIFSGSIVDYDDCLKGTDAVVAIEVIEHLYPDVLDKVPWNIFHEIKPKIAIFTTPNADFNALFPRNVGFRHPDHKFEWTRREFYVWTQKITKEYPSYSVKLLGIGKGPEGSESFGCCTQVAVFTRNELKDDSSFVESKEIKNYKLIRQYEYPFFVDKRTDEEKILNEVMYRVKFTMNEADYYNYEDCSLEIPLSHLMNWISKWCNSEEDLKKILLNHGFHVKERDECSLFVYFGLQSPSYKEDEGSSVDYSISEDVPREDFLRENWDSDCGDGNFSEFSDRSPVEEVTKYLIGRSLQDNSKVGFDLECCGNSGDDKMDWNNLEGKYSNLVSSKKKKRQFFFRNPSRNLVRFLSLPDCFGYEASLEGYLTRFSSDSGIHDVETSNYKRKSISKSEK